MVDIVEFVFVFAIVFVQMFLIHFLQVVEIVRAFGIHTFVDAEEFTVFLSNEGVAAMRASKPERGGNYFAGAEGLPTDFTLILPIPAIVVIDVMVRSSA